MTGFILTIQDIEQQTGLTRKYIDRCYARFGSLLTQYRKPSPDGNKYLYSNNALSIFQQVRGYRDEGMKLPEIRDRLTNELESQNKDMEGGGEVVENKVESSPPATPFVDIDSILSAVERAYDRGAKSERQHVLLLEEKVKVRREREQGYIVKINTFQANVKRRAELLTSLEKVSGFGQKKKRIEIMDRIRTIDSNALGDAVSDSTNNTEETTAG